MEKDLAILLEAFLHFKDSPEAMRMLMKVIRGEVGKIMIIRVGYSIALLIR